MALFKKELLAIGKTYRLWVVPAVFLFFALLSPPAAKYTPQIISFAMPKGISIKIPEPVLLDALIQWTKNLAQMGILATILFTMGLVSEEKARNTIQLVLTKPVSRTAFVLSKLLAQSILILGSIKIGAFICYLYALAIFGGDKSAAFTQANLLFLVYYFLIIVITLSFSTVFSNQIAAGGLSILGFAVLSILPVFNTALSKYSPGALPTLADKILKGQAGIAQSYWPILTTLILTVLFLVTALLIFQRQEL
jgi:ABC-2 type transport system permease protein